MRQDSMPPEAIRFAAAASFCVSSSQPVASGDAPVFMRFMPPPDSRRSPPARPAALNMPDQRSRERKLSYGRALHADASSAPGSAARMAAQRGSAGVAGALLLFSSRSRAEFVTRGECPAHEEVCNAPEVQPPPPSPTSESSAAPHTQVLLRRRLLPSARAEVQVFAPPADNQPRTFPSRQEQREQENLQRSPQKGPRASYPRPGRRVNQKCGRQAAGRQQGTARAGKQGVVGEKVGNSIRKVGRG